MFKKLTSWRRSAKPKSSKLQRRIRQDIFQSDQLRIFFNAVQYHFDIRFTSRELKRITNMDDLAGAVRKRHFEEHGKSLNSHMVWGSLQRLAEEKLNTKPST